MFQSVVTCTGPTFSEAVIAIETGKFIWVPVNGRIATLNFLAGFFSFAALPIIFKVH